MMCVWRMCLDSSAYFWETFGNDVRKIRGLAINCHDMDNSQYLKAKHPTALLE